jgi:hypothetical protein
MAALPLPSTPPPPPRAKALSLREPASRLVSAPRKRGRDRARVLVAEAMLETRATVLDVGDPLGIGERCARRALQLEDAAPIDLGDLIPIAESGPGGLRLVRRILAAFSVELDRITLSR